MKILFITILIFLISSINVFALEYDYTEIRIFHGYNKWTNVGPSQKYDYNWSSASYLLGKKLTTDFDVKSGLGVGYISTNYNDDSSYSFEYRLLIEWHKGIFCLVVGGGLAHLFNNDMPHLGETDVYGILTGEIGVKINNYKIAYGIEHLSSPWHDDSGHNNGVIVLSYQY